MENGPRAAVSHVRDDTVRLPVSVIIPAYQRADLVGRAVRSALEQGPVPPAEVIVVDDCSSDGTAQAAEEAGAAVLSLPDNRGQGGARNAGIEAAAQPWVALLDSDDEWLPGHLARVWAAREGYVLVSDSCLMSLSRRYVGNAGLRRRVLRTPADLLWPSNPVPANCALFPRADALAVGGFGARRLAEDLEFWLRLLERGRGLSLPGLGAIYHQHPGQISSGTRIDMHDAVREALDEMSPRPWITPALRRRLAAAAAWDTAREQAHGGRRGAALATAAGLARRPSDALAAATLIGWRLRGRGRGRLAPPA